MTDTTQNGHEPAAAASQTQPLDTSAVQTIPHPAVAIPVETGGLWQALTERLKGWISGQEQRGGGPVHVEETVTIGEMAIDADTPVADIVKMLADATGDTEEVIRGIEDNKEHPAAQIVIQCMIIIGYVVPPFLSALVGMAIGIKYAGTLDNFLSWAVFTVCIFFDLGLVFLMFAAIKLARRVAASGKGMMGLIGLSLFYLLIAVGSAAAQWAIYENHINLNDGAQVAGAIIRTFAVPIFDIICAVALPILIHVSLDKRLAEIEKKTEATIAINKKRIGARLALIQEAINTKSVLQKEKDYQSKNDLANQLIDLISQKILTDAKNSLGDSRQSGFRRDSYR